MNEADNLQQLFKDVNRAEFARDHKVPGGQSMIYQHITGRKPISLDCAVAYAIGFNRPLTDISPRLAEVVSRLPVNANHQPNRPSFAANQPMAAAYTANVSQLPVNPPLIKELLEVAGHLNDSGMHRLIERAESLRERFSKDLANPEKLSQ